MCKYPWQDVDLNGENTLAKLLRLVETDKTVLEVGCATGYVSKVMKEQLNCIVTGIEKEPDAAKEAQKYCHKVLIGDVEKIDILKALNDEKFDVIIFGDVLEHLITPKEILIKMKYLLNDNGYILASIPNIAHISVALELLEGKFEYRSLGLLDDTHLRFFSKENIQRLFREAGFKIVYWDRVILKPEETEFKTVVEKYPVSLLSFFEGRSEAQTYQFIVKAIPCQNISTEMLQKEAEMTVIEELQNKITQQELLLREFKKKVEEKESLLKEKESLLKIMLNSWSWKITAPLRWVHSKFLNLR